MICLDSEKNQKAFRTVYIHITLVLIVITAGTAGCGPDYEPGQTSSELIISTRDISFGQGPIVIPARPGETIKLKAQVSPPDSDRYRLNRRQKKWMMGAKKLGRGETITIEASEDTPYISQVTQSYWKVDEISGSTHVKEKIKRKIFLTIAKEKIPQNPMIDGYLVGHFPIISDTYSRWRDKLVNLKKNASYYQKPADRSPAGKLAHGVPLDLPSGIDTPTVKNGRVEVIYEDQNVWVKKNMVTIPYSVQSFSHIYEEPKWYYPVTEENKEAFILPKIPWKQFSHDQYYRREVHPEYPHYIPLDRKLLMELNQLRRELARNGYPSRIRIICGSRNPRYNLGEATEEDSLKALYSRHQYGDAVDFIVDSARNKRMDDMNGDGRRTIEDAKVIAEVAEKIREEKGREGGIGVYSNNDIKNRKPTPYIHLDLRGLKANWEIQ